MLGRPAFLLRPILALVDGLLLYAIRGDSGFILLFLLTLQRSKSTT